MQSNAARALVGVGVVAVAVVLLIVLRDTGDGSDRGSGDDSQIENNPRQDGKQPKARTAALPEVVVKGGEPVGGVRRLEYDEGELVQFRVSSDVADEIHIHGYDLSKQVKAEGSVGFQFPATIEGIFEGELEESGVQILELRVNP